MQRLRWRCHSKLLQGHHKCTSMLENSTHKCTNAVNNIQPIRNSSHIEKILSVYNRLQAGAYENGNGGKRRVSRLTQFIHATPQFQVEEPNNSIYSAASLALQVIFYFIVVDLIRFFHGALQFCLISCLSAVCGFQLLLLSSFLILKCRSPLVAEHMVRSDLGKSWNQA